MTTATATSVDDRSETTTRWWAILIALLAAAGAALLAPAPWPEGAGEIQVTVLDETTAIPVEVGDPTPIETDGVAIPTGVPIDSRVSVVVSAPGTDLQPDDVAVDLVLPDGTVEVVPVLEVDGSQATATRQPPFLSAVVMAVLAGAIVLWVSEAVPLFVTSLTIPIVLAVGGVGSAREVLAPFFDPIIVLFFAGFLLAEAMHKVELDRVAATRLVAVAGRGPLPLFLALLATSAFMSMWMSNTAAVTVMIPIVLAVTAPLEDLRFQKIAVLGVAYAATAGGVGSAIGTPANPIALRFINELTGRPVTFTDWFAFGLPMLFVFLPAMAAYLWMTGGLRLDPAKLAAASAAGRQEIGRRDPWSRPQLLVLAVFGLVFAGWLTQTWHGISAGIVALAGVVALAVIGKIVPADLGRISWSTLLTFGGGLTLGLAMTTSGTSDWLVTRMEGLAGLPPTLVILAVAMAGLLLTTVASNTASAATLVPLAIPLAGIVGIDPVLLVVVVAIATSIDFALVIGTPPTMLAYSTGMFTSREILRRGVPLDVIGVLILVFVVVPIWDLLGVI